MVCDTIKAKDQNPADRFKEVLEAQKRLEALLLSGSVKVALGRQGQFALVGWTAADRKDISDACAYRALANTWAMRQAIAKAETMAGKKLNTASLASGVHSHDGGQTWHPGH
jgi:hypothetical protein